MSEIAVPESNTKRTIREKISEHFAKPDDEEVLSESDVQNVLYPERNPSYVSKIEKDSPVSEEVISRLLEASGLSSPSVESEDETDLNTLEEQYAIDVIRSLKLIIDAARISDEAWHRLQIKTMETQETTVRAIKLATAVMNIATHGDDVRIHPSFKTRPTEVNAIDINLTNSKVNPYPKPQLALEITA